MSAAMYQAFRELPTTRFTYRGVRSLRAGSLTAEVSRAATRVHARFLQADLSQLGISEYNQWYLSEKLAKPAYEYCIITYMLSHLLSQTQIPRHELTLIDVGAGSGLTCLVAKALGIQRVVYCDVYDVSCRDAQRLGRALELPADAYIAGDLNVAIEHLQAQNVSCDLLVSHDCLEHVYDVDAWFRTIAKVPTRGMGIWLSSAANPLRPKTRRMLQKVAMQAEHEDRRSHWGHKQRDTLRSFFAIRREMIARAASGLSRSEVDLLARRTRGLRTGDIQQAVRRYVDLGELPPGPDHPTNTCDPYTGNWAERLMNPFELVTSAARAGLSLEAAPGFWAEDGQGVLKHGVKALTNALMTMLGPAALRLAPYYVLRGVLAPQKIKATSRSGRKVPSLAAAERRAAWPQFLPGAAPHAH